MGLDQNPGLVHFVFLNPQNLAQCVHLPAHVFEHLVHGVDLYFAALETLHGEADGHVLGRFHEQRRVRFSGIHVGRQELLRRCCRFTRVLGSTWLSSCCNIWGFALRSLPTSPNRVSRRMACMTSSSCRGTTPPAQVPPPLPRFALRTRTFGTLPIGALPPLRRSARLPRPQSAATAFADRSASLEFRAEGLGRDLGGNGNVAGRRVGGNELNFVDPDGRLLIVTKDGFDMLGDVLGSGARRKRLRSAA